VHTRALDLELVAGVVDVQVNQLATEVSVKEGQVRVATPDGLRRTQMLAGQVARAGGPEGEQLALRRAPDAAMEPVEPVILPVIHPAPTAPEAPARREPASTRESADPAPPSDRAALGGLAGAQAGVSRQAISRLDPSDEAPVPASRAPAAAAPAASLHPARVNEQARPSASSEGEADPITAAAAAHRAPAGLGATGPAPAVMQPGSLQSDDPASHRSAFERLTAGMLDGVQPSRPTPVRPRASIR
jgi:hypothetical protein